MLLARASNGIWTNCELLRFQIRPSTSVGQAWPSLDRGPYFGRVDTCGHWSVLNRQDEFQPSSSSTYSQPRHARSRQSLEKTNEVKALASDADQCNRVVELLRKQMESGTVVGDYRLVGWAPDGCSHQGTSILWKGGDAYRILEASQCCEGLQGMISQAIWRQRQGEKDSLTHGIGRSGRSTQS